MNVLLKLPVATCLAVLTSCAVTTGAKAEIRLPAIFGDYMILQAEVAAPVFGWADPDLEVTVAFATQVKQSAADNDGRWIVRFEGLQPSCEGRSLVIRTGGEQANGDRLEWKDVLVGEVWLASGQSTRSMSSNWCESWTRRDGIRSRKGRRFRGFCLLRR